MIYKDIKSMFLLVITSTLHRILYIMLSLKVPQSLNQQNNYFISLVQQLMIIAKTNYNQLTPRQNIARNTLSQDP